MQALRISNFAPGRAQISPVLQRALHKSTLDGTVDVHLRVNRDSASSDSSNADTTKRETYRSPPISQKHVLKFIADFDLDDLKSKSDTVKTAKNFLVDTIGVILSGTETPCSKVAYMFARETAGNAGTARLWQDGHRASAPAVAMAHALTCDSVDMSDGLEVAQGHCGVVVVPSAFAYARTNAITVSGKNLLESIIVGYEVGLRAGKKLRELENKLRAKLDPKYAENLPKEWNQLCGSSSGAWNALGSAATSARLLRLSRPKIKEALGIAEYYGPRSMMMRCIDQPTMLKDGAGMGAYAGTSAAILAKKGFTGAAAETVDESKVWTTIGKDYVLNDQYYKKFAVCYWSQCAMEGALMCLEKLGLKAGEETANNVKSVKVSTFLKAVSMDHPHPSTTEIAQYSLQFAVAAAIKYGHVGASEVIALDDHTVSTLSGKIKPEHKPEYTAEYPDQRLADVEVVMNDGRSYKVVRVQPPWTNNDLPNDAEIKKKFLTNVENIYSDKRANYLYDAVMELETLKPREIGELLDTLEQ